MNKTEHQESTSSSSARRRELLQAKLNEKRRIEKKSLEAVETLISKDITEECFIEQCRSLWQQSYQDCTEERAIVELCGYPLCSNAVAPPSAKIPQYKICTRSNKVFSMEVRRSFCSAWCYKASEWVKRQLSEVPLWMLEVPFDKPLDLLQREPTPRQVDALRQQNCASLVKFPISEKNYQTSAATGRVGADGDCIISDSDRVTANEVEVEVKVEKCTQAMEHMHIERQLRPQPMKKSADRLKSVDISAARLEALLCEWITITTLHHIVGQDRFLELRAKFDKGSCSASSTAIEQAEYLLKYERICRFLDEQDRLEGITYSDDDDEADNKSGNKSTAKPKIVRRHPKRGVLKRSRSVATAGPSGSTETSSQTAKPASSVTSSSSNSPVRHSGSTVDIAEPVLPPVEKHQRHAARTKILLERLTPIADQLAAHLPAPPAQIARDLSQLVDTLHLTRDNCMIRPKEAFVMFVAMLMLLDRRSGGEGTVPESFRLHTNSSLNSAGLSWGDLHVALKKATNPERLFAANGPESRGDTTLPNKSSMRSRPV